MSPLEHLVQQALRLELRDRAKLAEKLLESLEGLSEAEIEQLWVDEAERRLEDYQAGRSEGIPAEEVFLEAEDLAR